MGIDPELLREVMQNAVPFNRFLGMQFEVAERGYCRIRVPFREDFIGDPTRPALHGGLAATLADVAGGLAVWTYADDPRSRVSTIDMRIDYLRPGRLIDLYAEARVVRVGSRVGVADMFVFHADAPTEYVATGKGVYNIVLPREKSVDNL